jgi:predicted DNA-binding transcriptional regulator AlpA
MNNVVFLSLSKEELIDIVRDAVKQEVSLKKEKKLMTFNDTIEFLSISRSCLNEWLSRGKIPYKKLSKRIYFDRDEIISALEEAGNYKRLKELK